MKNVSIAIRSSIFAIIMPIWTAFYSFILLSVWIFPLRVRTNTVAIWTRSVIWLLKIICGVHYQVEGFDAIPKDRNGIIFSKHQSIWETYFLPGLFDRTTLIAKQELLWIPFFGWGMATTAPITINRNNKRSAMMQIMMKGKKYLEMGRWVLIFPEGTRVAPGEVGKYRLGGARLAIEANYPLLPVAHNAGRFWARKNFLKKPGTITVVFGPLIEPKGRTVEELNAEAKAWIETTMLRIDPPTGKKG
jgi:1-acyl-sn-glycerol-3-phosphate acyltransferase